MNNPRRFVRLAAAAAVLAALLSSAALAQDSSGNSMLSGAYRFRYVATVATNTTGTVVETTAAEGVLTFDGNGNYTISTGSQWVDNTVNSGAFQTIPQGSTGTYAINAAGIGVINNPNPNPNLSGLVMNGTFSQGVFTASTTESTQDQLGNTVPAVNDLLVAVAVGPVPTNSAFASPFWIGTLDFAQGTDSDVKNAMFQISPDGKGGLGSLTITGQANSNSASCGSGAACVLTQTVTGATYNFGSDGNAQFSLPAPKGVATPLVLVSGKRNVYVSADGNFLLGWTTNGFDIMFGVKALPSGVAGADSLNTGLFYLGGLGDQPTVAGMQGCGPFSFWGSQNGDGAENEWVHQRIYWGCASFGDSNGYPLPYDYNTWNEIAMNPDGSALDYPLTVQLTAESNYAYGDVTGNCVASLPNATCGFVAISSTSGVMGLTIGIHAPNLSGSGVYLSQVGVVNGASFSPPTASIAPGEFLTLFGSFGSGIPATGVTAPAGPFPTALNNVQVTINGIQAPIYFVSPNQINVVAPFELANATSGQASIQVDNNGVPSNTISAYLLVDASPGVFSYGPQGNGASDGIGFAIAEHGEGPNVNTLITPDSPALPGETIVLGLGGVGTVTPSIANGAVPLSTTLNYSDDFNNGNLLVFFHDFTNNVFFQQATVKFAGLYPQYPGEYQMNVIVPAGVGPSPDQVFIDVITPFADVTQVSVPVGAAPTSSTTVSSARAGAERAAGPMAREAMVPLPPQLAGKLAQRFGRLPAARKLAQKTQAPRKLSPVQRAPGRLAPSKLVAPHSSLPAAP